MIAAVVPAYRRPAELERCLRSLLAESELNRIFVINNGGLAVTVSDPRLVVLLPAVNLGVGGGYRAGMEAAVAEGSDWIWLLDEDAWVDAGSLQAMLAAAADWRLPPSALVPAVREASGGISLPPARRSSRWLLRFEPFEPAALDSRVTEVTIAAWAGLLVRAAALADAGPPDPALFIDGDDTEFTFRLHRVGPILCVPDAVVRHPRPAGGGQTLPRWRMYYDARNTLVFLLRHQPRRWLLPAEFVRLWLWQLRLVVRSPIREWPRRCMTLLRALRDGFGNRLGPRPGLAP